MRRVLAVSPHADDLELGCAGYLARQRMDGAELYGALVLAKTEAMNHAGTIPYKVRQEEFLASMGVLEATDTFIYKQTDKVGFDLPNHPKQKLVTWLDKLISDLQPTTVLIPVPSFHQDHQYVYECGMSACRPTRSKCSIKEVYAYEYPAAGWGPSSAFDTSRGATYVDITSTFEIKRKAMECHKSQYYNRAGSLISLEAIEIVAKMRGLEAGVPYAELLYLLRATL